MARRWFPRRGAVSAPGSTSRAQAKAQHNHPGQAPARWPSGAIPRWKQGVARKRAEPAPPRNRTPDKENERLQRRDAPVRRDPDVVWASGACSCAATERS